MLETSRPAGSGRGGRRLSRLLAVQSLYQWLLSAESIGVIQAFARELEDYAGADHAYYRDVFSGAVRDAEALRELFEPALDRPLTQISPVEHAILLLGTLELRDHPEVPYRVVINEAIELTKSLGGNEGHRFVNGVLDRLVKVLRPHEGQPVQEG